MMFLDEARPGDTAGAGWAAASIVDSEARNAGERLVDLTERCVPTPVTLYICAIEKIGHERFSR